MNGIKIITGFRLVLFFLFISLPLLSKVEDSLNVSSDTTSVVLQDTIQIPAKGEIIQNLGYEKDSRTHTTNFPFSIRENYYIFIPFSDFKVITLNGFTFYKKKFTASLNYLLLSPFYDFQTLMTNGFYQKEYDKIVPVLFTKAGTGSEKMSFAFSDFYKGNLKNFADFNFAYLGDAGVWHLNNNPSKNFHIYSKIKTRFGNFSVTKDIFDKTIPDYYISTFQDSSKSIIFKADRSELDYEIYHFKIAFQKFNTTIKDTAETSYQAYISHKFIFNFMELEPKYEMIYKKKYENYYHLKLSAHISKLTFSSKFINKEFKENILSANLRYKISKQLNFSLLYYSDDIFYNYSQKAISSTFHNVKLTFGTKQKEDEKAFFSQIEQNNTITFKGLDLFLSNNLVYNNENKQYFPLLHLSSLIKITKNLNYDNKIFIGAEYHFLTNDRALSYYDIYLNSFIGVGISKNFTLKADFVNMTNEYSYYNLLLSPYHINIGFSWLFFN